MILPRGEPVEARIRAVVIVILAPSRDQVSGMAQIGEQLLVQALVTQSAIGTFHEAVLHRLARGNVVQLDIAALMPSQDGVRRQFRAVVVDHHAVVLRTACVGGLHSVFCSDHSAVRQYRCVSSLIIQLWGC